MIKDSVNILPVELQIEQETHNYLNDTANWSKVTAVSGFALSALFLFFIYIYFTKMNVASTPYSRGRWVTEDQLAMAFYIVTALIHAILSFLQFNFASKIKMALRKMDQHALAKGFKSLKLFTVIRGIIAILMVVLFILVIITNIDKY